MEKRLKYNFTFIILLTILLAPSRLFSNGLIEYNNETIQYGGAVFNFFNLICILYIIIKINKSNCSSNVIYYYGIYCLLNIISLFIISFKTTHLEDTFALYFNSIVFLFACILFISENKDKSDLIFKTLMFAFIVLTIVSPFTLFNYSVYSDMYRSGTLGLGANDLGWIGSTIFIFALLIKKIKYRYFFFFTGIMGILLSSSRRMIIFIILFSIINFLIKKRKKILSIASLIICLLWALSTQINLPQIDNLFESWDFIPLFYRLRLFLENNDSSFFTDPDRIDYTKKILVAISQHPWGVGGILDIADNVFNFSTMHCHNIATETIAIYGILIGSIILLMYIVPSIKFLQKRTYGNRNLIIFTKSYLFSFGFYSLFDYPFVNIKNLFIFLFFISICIIIKPISEETLKNK